MKFFRKKEKVIQPATYDKAELLRKEKAKEPMTYAELEILQKEKQRELSNQVLRVIGLLGVLSVVVLAVGCFLYPYSLFNLFGQDKFWDCFGQIGLYAPTESHAVDGWVKIGQIYGIQSTVNETYRQVWAFAPGSSSMVNFFALGAWTIVPLSTIGLIATVVYCAFVVAYNIRDLINVIKHFTKRVGITTKHISETVVESVESSVDVKKKNNTKKKKEKKVEPVVVEESRKEEVELTGGYTDEQLDALLRGEDVKLDSVPLTEDGEKSLF